jgi:geranylgeranyl reductase family protein
MMKDVETIIVGAGPAGTSCAWRLKKKGRDVLILDKEHFPRVKLCAGWITDGVFEQLEFTPAGYPHSIVKLKFKFHYKSLPIAIFLPFAYSYSIRRYEFDHWLLERSGADCEQHQVKKIERAPDGKYVVDGKYRCEFLVGAAGTACPVRRQLFQPYQSKDDLIVTLEKEFEYPQRDDYCHIFLFRNGLRGYSWYVPKGDGYVNIGLGGLGKYFREGEENIHHHFQRFLQDLVNCDLLDPETAEHLNETGHPYFFCPVERTEEVKRDNCFLIGDSAGFASRDLGEGIAPAIESGLMAADEIMGTGSYTSGQIAKSSIAFQPVQNFFTNRIHY